MEEAPGAFPLPRPWLLTTNRVIAIVGMAISTCLLVMRIYTKIHIMNRFWWDDVCITLAWTFSVATQILILYGFVHSGYGIHIWDLPASMLKSYVKSTLSAAIIYIPSLAFAKLSLLALYYSLLHMIWIWEQIIIFVACMISSYSIALTLALIFACNPIKKNWEIDLQGGSCINRPAVYLATAITNTVSDVILIVIPIRIVWGLHMRSMQKWGVIAMFGIGSLTIITSIIRLATLMPLVNSSDQPHQLALAAIFINIEANFIIICGCLPYFRQFLRHHFPGLVSDRDRTPSSSRRSGDDSMSSQRRFMNTRMPSYIKRHRDFESTTERPGEEDFVEENRDDGVYVPVA